MAKNNFRVKLTPNADYLMPLVVSILSKHNADGANSPLQHLPMAALQSKADAAGAKHAVMLQLKRDSELVTEKRNLLIGYDAASRGFNSKIEGTLLFYIASVRDVLIGTYRENPRKLGEWGFTVDKQNKVVMPRNADKMVALSELILQRHDSEGAGSVLSILPMAAFQEKATEVQGLQADALRLRRESEIPTEERNRLLGTAKGQSTKTAGTVLYMICSVRDTLLGRYRGLEQQLGDWGFTVDRG